VNFFLPILPEVEIADDRIVFDERVIFTISTAIIYLIGQLPVYGLVSNASVAVADPFYSFRSVFGMEKATLFELGLLPVITAGFIWQLAVGLRAININLSLRADRELFQSGQKLTAIFLAIVYGSGLIYAGYFDNVIAKYNPVTDSLPLWEYTLILTQIVGWSFFVTLLVELFDKGYGFGSGILSFLALQSATNFVRDLIAFETLPLLNSNKSQALGALIHLVRNFKIWDLQKLYSNIIVSFTRLSLPNLIQFYIAVLSIIVVIALQNFRIEIPIRSTKVRAMNNVFPIKLLYTGCLPLLFAYTVLANVSVFGYVLIHTLQKLGLQSPMTELIIGKYTVDPSNNFLVLNSGVFSYLLSASTLCQSIVSPIRATVFSVTILILSIWFAVKWANISGSSPRDIAQQFKEQGISISGKRDISVAKELSRVIPVAAVSGAALLSASALVGEYLGGLGKGVSVIIGVCSAFGVLEEFMVEFQQSGGASQLTNALGNFGQ